MKRHAHHVNIVVFQNFFMKRKQAGPDYQTHLIDEPDLRILQNSLVCTQHKYPFQRIVGEGQDVDSGIVNKQEAQTNILNGKEFIDITHQIGQKNNSRTDGSYIFQAYWEPYLDCLYEVNAEAVTELFESNQLIFDKF